MQVIYDVNGTPQIHLDVLKAICGDASNKSMLDLGCGFAPQTRRLGFASRTYVDMVKRDLGPEMPYFIHCEIQSNIYFKHHKYDVCFCLDVIEHFEKWMGYHVLNVMQEQSNKRVVFTPLGEYLIGAGDLDSPDTHRSGWTPDDFPGWASIVFPNFHAALNIGAFFAFDADGNEFERIINELNTKTWSI